MTVKDVTPPSITCPPAVTVEFSDERGGTIMFAAPSANDNCGPVTVSSIPPSASIFPIGATSVVSSAVDSSGNRASCSFPVTVLGALGVKQAVLGEMRGLNDRDLDGAASDLQLALDPSLWIDQTHVRDASEKNSFNQLTNVIKRRGGDPKLQGLANRIVKADRLICTSPINDASPNTTAYSQAVSLRSKGDEMVRAGQLEAAIEQYRNAWSKVRP